MKKTKNGIIAVAVALLALSVSGEGRAYPPHWVGPDVTNILPGKTFIPPGFDSNDNVEVVVTGMLINTCYKLGDVSARVDTGQQKIYVTQKAYFYSQGWCAQVMVPYTEVVEVGLVPVPGKYQVVALDQQGQEHPLGVLPVAAAQSASQDELLYAPVQDAYLDPQAPAGTHALILTGTFGSDCMRVQEIRVLNRAPNVMEVLPIAAIQPGAACQGAPKAFQARVEFTPAWTGSTLIHIRSLNGKSVNKVVDF